jgi:hypothetical protein
MTLLAAAVLALSAVGLAIGQQPTTTTQTPTTVTTQTPTTVTTQTPTTVQTTVQNPDGTFTVIEYPVGKEVTVMLDPVALKSANGTATILRDDAGTRIRINLKGLPADATAINLYAVDETGAVTSLGPVNISNGVATASTTTPLTKFMLIASPEANLSAYDPNNVSFRSAVPKGYAVIPRVVDPVGEKVSATTTSQPVAATAYTVPMLNIPMFKKGSDTKMKVNFSGPLTGARANIFITPRKDGPTEVKIRFHELKDAPAGKVYQVWAVSPDNRYVKLGQIVNAAGRNEAEIRSEVTLSDFGLLITEEDANNPMDSPHGPNIGVVEMIK